jgi:hypothetical protein
MLAAAACGGGSASSAKDGGVFRLDATNGFSESMLELLPWSR